MEYDLYPYISCFVSERHANKKVVQNKEAVPIEFNQNNHDTP